MLMAQTYTAKDGTAAFVRDLRALADDLEAEKCFLMAIETKSIALREKSEETLTFTIGYL